MLADDGAAGNRGEGTGKVVCSYESAHVHRHPTSKLPGLLNQQSSFFNLENIGDQRKDHALT